MSTQYMQPTAGGPFPLAVEIQNAESLSDKTVFLKARFGILGNSRKVSGTDVLETDADKTLLKVQKQLLESAELDAIRKADGKMRQYLYNTCLPFDIGTSLLPVGLIETVHAKMTAYRDERQALVNTFMVAYPALCAKAGKALGTLYSTADYPDTDTVRAKFVFDWQYVSFGVPGQLKGISGGIFEAEKEKAAKQMQAATEEITLLMRQTLHELVSHLADRLKDKDGKPQKLHKTAVTNLQEFLETFDLRNVTNDAELAAVAAKAKALIHGVDVENLKESEVFKGKIRAGMTGISSQLAGLVEEKAGRKYREN